MKITLNYLINLLSSFYNKYIGDWKPKDGESRFTLRFYNDGRNIGSKRQIIAFDTPYNCGGKFIFKNYNDMKYFYSRYYNLFDMIKKKGGCI